MLEAIRYTPHAQKVIAEKNDGRRIYTNDVVEDFTVPVHVVHDTETGFFGVITRRFESKYAFTDPENPNDFTPVTKK